MVPRVAPFLQGASDRDLCRCGVSFTSGLDLVFVGFVLSLRLSVRRWFRSSRGSVIFFFVFVSLALGLLANATPFAFVFSCSSASYSDHSSKLTRF